jgi:hypothetical protein
MALSNVANGKALEWAVASRLAIALGGSESIGADLIIESKASSYAKECFDSLDNDDQIAWLNAASRGVAHIVLREKKNQTILDPIGIEIASDSVGVSGDVRDVIVKGPKNSTLGISCKNNHDAFKHPRLSGSIDFVADWKLSESGCSKEYWDQVNPIFERLAAIRKSSDSKMKFSDLDDLRSEVMIPIMNAFVGEMKKVASNGDVDELVLCKELTSYVIGNHDFYKLIRDNADKQVRIMAFNFNGTLYGRRPKSATQLLGINYQKESDASGNSVTVVVQLDQGYAFKMRLHTASSRVEPSLKFDIQAVGLPPRDIYQHFIDV